MSSLRRILRRNEISFGYRIGYLFNHFSGPVYKWTSLELGIQRPEFATLFCVAHIDGATATDVVELTGTPKNSVSRAVSKLIDLSFIRRETDDSDARRTRLSITPRGEKAYAKILPMFQERQEKMISVLSASERAELSRLLNKLVERDDDWARPL